MYNHQAIAQTKQRLDEERRQEIVAEKAALAEEEELAKRMAQADVERQQRIAKEAHDFMVEAQANKEARQRQQREETLELERKIVQKAVSEAMAEREAQIKRIQAQHKKAHDDYVQNMEDVRIAKEREAEARRREDELIKKYQEEQDRKIEERKKYLEIKTLAFDSLLQKMADMNRAREDKLRRAEEMRIEIAQFMEDARLR